MGEKKDTQPAKVSVLILCLRSYSSMGLQHGKSKNKIVKGRDWAFIVYPESAPSDWRDILNKTHLRWIESPLHDKDVNADGEVKKEHWHILLSYDGPVGLSAVKNN